MDTVDTVDTVATKATRVKVAGRVKGTPNKLTRSVKEAIEQAFNTVGGHQYLVQQAKENPVAFMALVGKILPKDITVAGDPDQPLQVVGTIRLIRA